MLFDIAIFDGETEIEPAEGSMVQVEVKLVKGSVTGLYSDVDSPLLINYEPLKADEQQIDQKIQVIHDVKEGSLEVVDVRESSTEEAVVASFLTDSFSNWLVFLDEDISEITIGYGDTITLRPYSEWTWQQDYETSTSSWVKPNDNQCVTVSTNNYHDGQLDETYTSYTLTAKYNPGSFYIEQTNGKKIKVNVSSQPVSPTPRTVQGIPEIKVNLFNYNQDKTLDVSGNVASSFDQSYPPYNYSVNQYSALKFLGWGASNGGSWINNYTATSVTPNIVQNKISDSDPYPKLNGNGNTSLKYLFSNEKSPNDVRAYMNVPGLFQKDSKGYYYFNSNSNYAYFNGSQFVLYEHTYSQKTDNGITSKPIGFFPFHMYDSNNDLSVNHNTNLDHHFGLSMEVKFSLPEGKVIHNEDGTTEPIEFLFSGDDDLWVFIDDDLTLDMGGIHQPLYGGIDFTNDSRFVAGKEYTMRVFYVERGGCDSNCSIKFNMPLSQGTGDVKVAKVKTKENGETENHYLEGAEFGIWENAECSGEPIRTMTSGENGLATIDGLPVRAPGQVYYMKEIKAPTGYAKGQTIYTVTASQTKDSISGKFIFSVTDPNGNELSVIPQEPYGNATSITNDEIKPIDVMLEKKWRDLTAGTNTAPNNAKATFKLYRRGCTTATTELPNEGIFVRLCNENGNTIKQCSGTFYEGDVIRLNYAFENSSIVLGVNKNGNYYCNIGRNQELKYTINKNDKNAQGQIIFTRLGNHGFSYVNWELVWDSHATTTTDTSGIVTQEVASFTLPDNADQGESWKKTIPNLDAYDANGDPYEYWFEETSATNADGYIPFTAVNASNPMTGTDTQVITNTKTDVNKVRVIKRWYDFYGNIDLTKGETAVEVTLIADNGGNITESSKQSITSSNAGVWTVSGDDHTYHAEEKAVEGYTTTYSTQEASESTENTERNSVHAGGVIYINNRSNTVSMKILKVVKGTSTPLSGATFKLERVEDENGHVITVGDDVYSQERIAADTTGELTFTGLKPGTYKLDEIRVPDGYIKKEGPYFITIGTDGKAALNATLEFSHELITPNDGDDNEFTIENEPGAVLPSTGGNGVAGIYAIGSLMVLAAALLLAVRRRKTMS